MAETTRETLVRTIRRYGPDGNSVAHVEVLDVEVTWPGKRPRSGSSNGGYVDYGVWKMAEPTPEERDE